jgi:hypothetical protein
MYYYVYTVTTSKKEVWTGHAASMDAACKIAQSVFLCPDRAIVRCELTNVIFEPVGSFVTRKLED